MLYQTNLPKTDNLCSLSETKSFKHALMSRLSAIYLCTCSINKLFKRTCVIVDLKYVFILRRAEALRSLTALVAGITKIKTHGSEPRGQGK